MSALHITKENFDQEVLNSRQPVLIDFWASWCGPCQMLLPVIEELAQEVQTVKICKINVDEQPELAQQFQVMTIPTLVLMDGEKVLDRSVGVKSKEEILKMLGKIAD